MRPGRLHERLTTAAIAIAGVLVLPQPAVAGWQDAGRPTTTLAGTGGVTAVAGTPYATWEETGSPSFVAMSSWNGSTWSPVAGPLRADPGRRASDPSIADVAGTPWVAFVDDGNTRDEVRVAKPSASGMAWDLQGGALNVTATDSASEPRIASVGGVPYVAFLEFDQAGDTNKLRVRHWDGAAWVQDGGALNLSGSTSARSVSIADIGGTPHVAWSEPVPAPNTQLDKIHVARLSGTTWVTLGTSVSHHPSGESISAALADDAGAPLLAWRENEGPAVVRVARWNGSAWSEVGADPPDIERVDVLGFSRMSLVVAGGVPYVGWTTRGDLHSQQRWANWNGRVWTRVGGSLNRDPDESSSGSSATVVAGKPFVVWPEWNGTSLNLDFNARRLVNDSETASLQLAAPTAEAHEADGSVSVTVQRVGGSAGEVAVNYDTADDTATAGPDYTAQSGTVRFADGETTKTISIPLNADTNAEPDQTFTLTLSGPGGDAQLGTPTTATITIHNGGGVVDTRITTGPDRYLQDMRFRFFLFDALPPEGATFECALDAAAFAPCTSPFDPGDLSEGQHRFAVRAAADGATDATPASRDFFVDTVRPTVTLTLDGRQVGDAFAGSVGFKVLPSDADPSSGIKETRCAIDPPSVPQTASAMRDHCLIATAEPGVHTVYAAAIDEAGNAGIPVSTRFEILRDPDTAITRGPEAESWNAAPDFAFTSTTPGSTFRCRFDDGAFAECKSGIRAPKLESGAHTFAVYAVSPAGLADSTPAVWPFFVRPAESRSWDCDISPFALGAKHICDVSTDDEASYSHAWGRCGERGTAICKRSSPRCPVGARCTLKLEASFEHQDVNTAWRMGVQDIYQPAPPSKFTECLTRFVHDSCTVRQSHSFLGENTDWGWQCWSEDATRDVDEKDKPAGFQRYGPDSARRLRCLGTFTIAPAEPLAVDPSGPAGDVFVPGPGILRATPRTPASPRPVAAAAQAPFKTITKKVTAAGVVRLSFKLSPAAKRTYRKKRKLAISTAITFTPTEGEAMRKTQKIVLRPVARARDQNLERYRSCRKLKKQRRYRKLDCGHPPRS